MKILCALLLITALSFSCNKKANQQALAADCFDAAKKNTDALCPMNYAPVCGCDGKTYSNECVATNAGILSWSEGACPDN